MTTVFVTKLYLQWYPDIPASNRTGVIKAIKTPAEYTAGV
jgi:hypothetical protein